MRTLSSIRYFIQAIRNSTDIKLKRPSLCYSYFNVNKQATLTLAFGIFVFGLIGFVYVSIVGWSPSTSHLVLSGPTKEIQNLQPTTASSEIQENSTSTISTLAHPMPPTPSMSDYSKKWHSYAHTLDVLAESDLEASTTFAYEDYTDLVYFDSTKRGDAALVLIENAFTDKQSVLDYFHAYRGVGSNLNEPLMFGHRWYFEQFLGNEGNAPIVLYAYDSVKKQFRSTNISYRKGFATFSPLGTHVAMLRAEPLFADDEKVINDAVVMYNLKTFSYTTPLTLPIGETIFYSCELGCTVSNEWLDDSIFAVDVFNAIPKYTREFSRRILINAQTNLILTHHSYYALISETTGPAGYDTVWNLIYVHPNLERTIVSKDIGKKIVNEIDAIDTVYIGYQLGTTTAVPKKINNTLLFTIMASRAL